MLKTLDHGRLAQLVEHCDHTAGVTGSSPVAPTTLHASEILYAGRLRRIFADPGSIRSRVLHVFKAKFRKYDEWNLHRQKPRNLSIR
jgi:hypothetical protein